MTTTPSIRVLIVRVGAMGDVLHGLPAVTALRRALPQSTIGWAIEPRWAPLLVNAKGEGPVVSRVHLAPTKSWKRRPFALSTLRQILALRRELRAEHYDVCIDLQGSIRSAVIGWMAHAGRLVGPAQPRERLARRLYGVRVPFATNHVIEQAFELVGAGVGEALSLEDRVTLPVDAESEGWCGGALARHGVAGPFALLAPEAGWGAKQWPAERYAELAKALTQDGFKVLVNAAPSSPAGCAEQISAAGYAEVVHAKFTHLLALTRRAALVVGGDTGPVHLAAALGRPVVALFGPTDPDRNGPYFAHARVRVLRHAASLTDHKRHKNTEAGLAQITVEEVLAAAWSLLEEPEVG